MPQLDPTWFVSQIFWLLIMFGILYLLMSKVALPPISKVLDDRQKKIEGDIKQATKLKEEAEAALVTYEDALKDANSEAKKIMSDAREEMARIAAQKDKDLTEKLTAQLNRSKDSLAKSKEAALKEVREMSTDLAITMVEKLTGVKPSSKDVNEVLNQILKEQA